MLKVYKSIAHKVFEIQKLIEHLVDEVWCKADNDSCYDKLNDDLKTLYDNPKSDWFKNSLEEIYNVAKGLNDDEKLTFRTIFYNNNKVEHLCSNPQDIELLNKINEGFLNVVKPFFQNLYTRLLDLAFIKTNYGSKKQYYDSLIDEHKHCPCCGYGSIKTVYDKGHSALDHYLPQKHYPFSTVNFKNLFPLCTECNSDNKGEKDILESGKKVFYPLSANHPNISVLIDVNKESFNEIIIKTKSSDKIEEEHIKVSFEPDSEEVESWDTIFGIKKRYFGRVALNRKSWLDDVRQIYRDSDINTPNYEKAFDKVIEYDSNKELGFLKSPFLSKMKSYTSLIQAYEEVTGDYIIK